MPVFVVAAPRLEIEASGNEVLVQKVGAGGREVPCISSSWAGPSVQVLELHGVSSMWPVAFTHPALSSKVSLSRPAGRTHAVHRVHAWWCW